MIQAGEAAPDFELETDGGGSLRLSDLHGKRVILFFYPKDDTSGCTKEACGFRDSQARFEAGNAIVLGISPDGVASHDKFKDKFDLNFPLLADPGHAIADAYGVWGKKKMYGREYEGVFRTTFVIGPDGTVERVYDKVKPENHAEEILEHLAAIPC